MSGVRSLVPFDPRLLLLRRAAVTMVAVLASFLTLWFAGLPVGLGVTPAVLAVVLAITFSRSDSRAARTLSEHERRRARVWRFASIPLVSVAATGVGWLFHSAFPVGAAVFVLGLSFAVWVRRFGPLASRLGSIVSLPLMAVLVVPVRLPATLSPWLALVASVLAAVVAVAWVEVAQWAGRLTRFLPQPDADAAARMDARADALASESALADAGPARAAQADAGPTRAAQADAGPAQAARADALASGDARAVVAPGDARIPTTAPPAADAVDDPREPTTTPGGAPGGPPATAHATEHATALTSERGVSSAPATAPSGEPSSSGRRASTPRTPDRMPASTRMAVQLAVALTAAFVVGSLVFADHWGWVVLTAFIVCAGNRGRGDVVYKSILRVAGAIAGTVAAVALAESSTATNTDLGHADGTLITVAVFIMLFFGLWLRDVNYAFWAAAVTVILTLVQGATATTAAGAASIAASTLTTGATLTTGVTLGERVVAIVAGALCGVLASWFVLPVRTEAVVRRRLADALSELSTAVHPRSEPAQRSAALWRFSRELERLQDVAPALRAHRRFAPRTSGRGRVGAAAAADTPNDMAPRGAEGAAPLAHRAVGAHQADLIDAVAGLEPLVADLVARMVEGEHPLGRARLGALARAVGEARRTLASAPRTDRATDPTSLGGADAPRGTAATIAAVATVRAMLVDDLVHA